MQIVSKAFLCFGKNNENDYCAKVVIYAETAGKAKAQYNYESGYDVPFTEIVAKRSIADDILKVGDTTEKRYLLEESQKDDEFRANIKNLAAQNKGKKCYIYSGEWQAYWRSNAGGYTSNKNEAGLYDIEDAVSRVSHCSHKKQIQLHIICNA
jgi:hypothetical protein